MAKEQNPIAKGNRVSWKALHGPSTDTLTLSAYRAQHLIGLYGLRPEYAVILAALAFGGIPHG